MQYFLLGLAILLLLLYGGRGLANTDPKKLVKRVRMVGGYGALALGLLFAVTGRFALAVPLFFAGTMLLGRNLPFGFPFPGGFPGSADKSVGQQSQVRTAFFEMRLDHDTGEIDGRILKGRFADRELSELNRAELIALWTECREQDSQSAQLLEAFLDRRAPGWREAAGGARSGGYGAAASGERMTLEEAYEVLGLAPGASEAEIRQAHRTLMKKLHPDQGGSTYLASKINEAKDLLLGRAG